MKSTVIIYHAGCPDGFSAAWAAWKKFKDRAEYYPVEPRTLPSVKFKGRDIYVLDNSLSHEDVAMLLKNKNTVTIIDHHISSEHDVKSAPQFVFDNDHSGAMLAWMFFHPKKPIPQLLKHVEDIDLWKFKLAHTKEIGTITSQTDFTFKEWNKLAAIVENPIRKKALVHQGKLLLAYDNELIKRLVENAYEVEFLGHRVLVSNTPLLHSETGNALTKKLPPLGIVWYEKHGVRRFSLRSDGSVDVSKLAAKFGGGGHKAASGFTLSSDAPFPWKVITPHV
jgi:uncharacterized protein